MAKLTERAFHAPGQCLFSQDIEGPWIDTEVLVPWVNPYGYVSAKYWELVARDVLDMIPRREVEEELDELRKQVAEYAAKVENLMNLQNALVKAGEFENGEGI